MSLPVNTVAGPDNPNPAIYYVANTHDVDIGSGDVRFATDFLGMQFHGDCHTHIDALCHIAYKGRLYNGRPAGLMTVHGAETLDITRYANGLVGRGVMIDVARHRGIPWLEPGEIITRAEIEAVEQAEGYAWSQAISWCCAPDTTGGDWSWAPGTPVTRGRAGPDWTRMR